MQNNIQFFEMLEISNESATQSAYSFPTEIGNIGEMKIKNIIAFSSDNAPFSPNARPVIDPILFKSSYLKIAKKGKFIQATSIPLEMLSPKSNNGLMFDFGGLQIDPKSCAIMIGKNDVSQLGKVFMLGFVLEV